MDQLTVELPCVELQEEEICPVAGGNLTGYAGGMEMKKFLLELEQGKNHL